MSNGQSAAILDSPTRSQEDDGTNLDRFLEASNIAEFLDQDLLNTIGARVVKDFNMDKESRADWEERDEKWMKLATQVLEVKNEPFEGASNIKYPTLALAAVQFAARSYPQIVQGADVVKGKPIGADPEGQKAKKARRIGQHMSWQLLNEMEEWEDDMDGLLTALPIEGCEFKKTYFNPSLGRNVSEWIRPVDCIVNYYARTLEKASRITHVYKFTQNEIVERERSGMFLEIDYGLPIQDERDENAPTNDEDAPHTFYEQHRYWDLDNDGYQEPYIITVHKDTQKVARIVARWNEEGIHVNNKGEIIHIDPVHYFTRYIFMPSPDGGIYGQGFGSLLGPINDSINMTLNQLHDAGTMANLSGKTGFIGKGLSAKSGKGGGIIKLKLGEFQNVNFSGDDIRKAVWQANFGEPSIVLFQLLGILVTAGDKLGSITDPMVGESPGANVPATTTLALIEQGLKVFSAIFKRIYRSLTCEYRKIFRLNRLFLPDEAYYAVLDEQQAIKRIDYNNSDYDVQPVADPNQVSNTQQLLKAQALLGLMGMGLNDDEIKRRYLTALQEPDIDKLMEGAQPPPDPKLILEAQKLDLERDKFELDLLKSRYEILKLQADSIKTIAQAEATEEGSQIEIYKAELQAIANQIGSMGGKRNEQLEQGRARGLA
jgi:chaperonin GroES